MRYETSVLKTSVDDRDSLTKVNAHMKERSDGGWRLHSLFHRNVSDLMGTPHIEYHFFWEREA